MNECCLAVVLLNERRSWNVERVTLQTSDAVDGLENGSEFK